MASRGFVSISWASCSYQWSRSQTAVRTSCYTYWKTRLGRMPVFASLLRSSAGRRKCRFSESCRWIKT